MLLALPFYNIVGTPRGLFAAIGQGDGLFVVADLILLVFGASFIAIAVRVARYKPKAKRSRAPRTVVAASTTPELEPAE
jgi:hypothetical protein